MPVGRKRQLNNFERRAAQFVREIELKRVKDDARYGHLPVGRKSIKGLIYKRNSNDFHLTRHITEFLKNHFRQYPPKLFVPVFPVHSSKHPVQEHFNAPMLSSMFIYLGHEHSHPLNHSTKVSKREVIRNPQRELCKNILRNPHNRWITGQDLETAYTELISALRPIMSLDVDGIHLENVLVLGCTRDKRIRLAIIDAH